jgi:hypothetical protein
MSKIVSPSVKPLGLDVMKTSTELYIEQGNFSLYVLLDGVARRRD